MVDKMSEKKISIYEQLEKKFCKVPFEFADLSYPPENHVWPCCWVKKPLGQLDDKNSSLEKVWNSEAAIEVRKSILDGSFKYCSIDDCPHIHSNQLPDKNKVNDPYFKNIIDNNITTLPGGPRILHFNNDQSCNLSCPSCRKEKSLVVNGEQFEKRKRIWDHSITPEVLSSTETIRLTGAGDPFASKIYRDFLLNLDGNKYPQLKIDLFTNGVLFDEKMWNSIHRIQKNIHDVRVSLDSMTKPTYDVVRRGGDFAKVIENVKFLSQQKTEGFFNDLVICFVVQTLNYKEMVLFVKFALELKNVKVHFQRIINWGTFSDVEFLKHAIYLEEHFEYQNFIDILKDPIFKNPMVDMGNIAKHMT